MLVRLTILVPGYNMNKSPLYSQSVLQYATLKVTKATRIMKLEMSKPNALFRIRKKVFYSYHRFVFSYING